MKTESITAILTKLLHSATQIAFVVIVLVVGIAAYNLGASGKEGTESTRTAPTETGESHPEHAGEDPETIWTCSMHPQIRMDEPGLCPLCGMELIPVEETPALEATSRQTPGESAESRESSEPIGYACAMNCLPPLSEPGNCPICGMEMVPIYEQTPAADTDPERTLVMSTEARALAQIQTSPVVRGWVENTVRMVGNIDYDETRLAKVSAYVGGRLDRLYVDYEGTRVREGDHMVYLYSPDLLTAQEELLQAKRAYGNLSGNALPTVRESARQALEAVRERLRLWGLRPEQIREIEERGTRVDHITIYAPEGGIVVEIHVREGEYVQTGSRIYTIAQLDHLWVKLKAYESDLPWLRYGQDVVFTTEAYPGEEFHGRISFIDPVLDPMTRTVDVRVNVENTDGRLKPGMYVRALAKTRLAQGGNVIAPDLAGKWISPMHPEIIKDEPGTCDVCGMDLVPAEELGYIAASPGRPPLTIPDSAPLITGKRAVVYVEVPGADRPTYEGREIVLGPRAADRFLVLEGLREGERVVTRGNFKIDSALQISAKKSMMNPQGGRVASGHEGHGQMTGSPPAMEVDHTPHEHPVSQPASRPASQPADHGQLALAPEMSAVFETYFPIQAALASDDLEAARHAFGRLRAAASNLSVPSSMGADPLPASREAILAAAGKGAAAGGVDEARRAFERLSNTLIDVINRQGNPLGQPVYRYNCLMAFNNQGADWLQISRDLKNPYFGAEMLLCGTREQEYKPAETADAAPTTPEHPNE